MPNSSNESNPPIQSPISTSVERIRSRLKLIDAQVEQRSHEEKMNQLRQMVAEEAKAILLPAMQDAMAEFTLQFLPDPKLATSIERTSFEVGRLADNMTSMATAQKMAQDQAKKTSEEMGEAMVQMVSETVSAVHSSNTRTAETLLLEQKIATKRQRLYTTLTMAVVCAFVVVGALGIVGYLRWEERSKLGTEIASLRQERTKASNALEETNREAAELKAKHDSLLSEIEKLRADETSVRLSIKESADTVTAVNQARAQAQTDIRKLQDIQEQNRFKLLQGQEGTVFVQIPSSAKPFTYQGKSYIKVDSQTPDSAAPEPSP